MAETVQPLPIDRGGDFGVWVLLHVPELNHELVHLVELLVLADVLQVVGYLALGVTLLDLLCVVGFGGGTEAGFIDLLDGAVHQNDVVRSPVEVDVVGRVLPILIALARVVLLRRLAPAD